MDVTAAILAGGRGTRIGGDKAMVELAGRPLITYALQAAHDAGLPTVIVAKATTRLPALGVPILLEPDAPVHPLAGVIAALDKLPAVIALPCDMPFVPPAGLAELAGLDAEVATLWPGHPFPSLYRRGTLPLLCEALEASASVRSTQAQSRFAPAATAAMRESTMMTVNTAEDLAAAERLLSDH